VRREDLGLGRKAPPDRDGDPLYLMERELPSGPRRLEKPPPVKKSWGLPPSQLRFQGGTGTCTEHGAIHLVKASPIATRAESRLWPQFSAYREFILDDEWKGNDHESKSDDPAAYQFGSSVRAAMKWLVAKGYAGGYAWTFTRAPASLWVRTHGPVVAGTNWYSSMFNLTAEGFAKITPTATLDGGHCYCWIGADERRGIDLWANSWVRWGISRRAFSAKPGTVTLANSPVGDRGFFMTAAEVTERLINEDGEIATATETRWKPKALGAAADAGGSAQVPLVG
jgi:hypothetical protein